MTIRRTNESNIPTADEAGERARAFLAANKGKRPVLPANRYNDPAANERNREQDRAEQQQRDERTPANEEQITELKGAPKTPEEWATYAKKAAQWRSNQPNDFKDPKLVNKAERRTDSEMRARVKSRQANEGGMGGINRCAPSNDVSYEDVLNDVTDKWHGQKAKVTELDDKNGTLRQAAANRPLPPNGQGGIMRSGQQSVNIKTGLDQREKDAAELRRRQAIGDHRMEESFESMLKDFTSMTLDEMKRATVANYVKDASRDSADRASGEGFKAGKKGTIHNTADETRKEKNRQKGIDRAADKLADPDYGSRLEEFINEAMADVVGDEFANIARAGYIPPAAKPKAAVKTLPLSNKNFTLHYRPQTSNLQPLKWIIKDVRKDEIKHEGSSADLKVAQHDAEEWLASKSGMQTSTNHVTVNFNASFAKAFAEDGETLYCDIWEGPTILVSTEPQKGFKKTVIRTPEHSRTAGAALLPVMGISPSEANSVGLDGNSRYTLGPQQDMGNDVYAYDLIWHSKVEPGVRVPLKEPIIQTSTNMATNEGFSLNRLGQPEVSRSTDDKYGIFVNGKLQKSYWGEDAANRMLKDFQRRFPGQQVTIKPV